MATLRKTVEIAEDVARAVIAINALKSAKNGAQVAELVSVLERNVRKAVAARMKARRRANRQRRSNGRFA